MSQQAFFSFLSPSFAGNTHYNDAGKSYVPPQPSKEPAVEQAWHTLTKLWQQPQAIPQSLSQSLQPLANRLLPHEQQLNIDDALHENQQALHDMVNPLSPLSLLAPDAVIVSSLVNINAVNTAVLRQQQAMIKQHNKILTQLYQQVVDLKAGEDTLTATQAAGSSPVAKLGKQITVYV